MRTLVVLLPVVLTACGDDAPASTGTPFWQAPADTSGDVVDTRDPADTADDEEDEEDEEDEDEEQLESRLLDYVVIISTDDWTTGTFEWTLTDFDGTTCDAVADLVSITPVDTCDGCAFAAEIVIGDSTITDGSDTACETAEALGAQLAGPSYAFGHGTTFIGTEYGYDYYSLWTSDGESWSEREDGWSLDDTEESEWWFGYEGLELD